MKRKQFTFYRSYFEAIWELAPQDREGLLEAIIEYGLDCKEPEGLSSVQRAMFRLVRPTLDAGRRMAQGGSAKKGGKRSPKGGCREGEQEEEQEEENEGESENENESECSLRRERDFERFWDAYPVKLGKEQARRQWDRRRAHGDAVLEGLEKWKRSDQWRRDGGRFIPRAEKFLAEEHDLCPPRGGVPMGASGELGQAELEAIERVMRGE